MIGSLKRALSLAGTKAKPGVGMQNAETGCNGTAFAPSESQEVATYEGPHHTEKCKCLTKQGIALEILQAHTNKLLKRGLVAPVDAGTLILKLMLCLPVAKELELKLNPEDKSLKVKLPSGEPFPFKLERSATLESFPALEQSDLDE